MAVFIADLNTKIGMQETGAGGTDVPAWLAQATINCLEKKETGSAVHCVTSVTLLRRIVSR